jgi:hypothetical protein
MSRATRNASKNLVAEPLLSRYPYTMSISLKSLEEAVSIRRQIAALEQRLSAILGTSPSTRKGKRRMSPQARAKIAAAMRVRWARKKGGGRS